MVRKSQQLTISLKLLAGNFENFEKLLQGHSLNSLKYYDVEYLKQNFKSPC